MTTLTSELWQVVEARGDAGPWVRRALLAAESQAAAAGVRTWHVERATYGVLLVGAVVAQYHDTLGAAPALDALTQVSGLAVSSVGLLVGAELDSISTREREKAEAEGRDPVKVECSPRAAQLRTLLPWLALLGLALAFGWMGALGVAWRLGYPRWRRWYRQHRPLGRAVCEAGR